MCRLYTETPSLSVRNVKHWLSFVCEEIYPPFTMNGRVQQYITWEKLVGKKKNMLLSLRFCRLKYSKLFKFLVPGSLHLAPVSHYLCTLNFIIQVGMPRTS